MLTDVLQCGEVWFLVMYCSVVWLDVLYCCSVKSVYSWRQPEKDGISGETELSVSDSRGGQVFLFCKIQGLELT